MHKSEKEYSHEIIKWLSLIASLNGITFEEVRLAYNDYNDRLKKGEDVWVAR